MSEPTQQNQRQNTDMRRAKDAWDNIKSVSKKSEAEQKKYASRAKDIGALIMTTGLGAAMAFLLSKATANDQMPKLLYSQISRWVVRELKDGENADLLDLLTTRNTAYYRRATTEALAYTVWLKRFVEAELNPD